LPLWKQADVLVLDLMDYNQLPYYFGKIQVMMMIKRDTTVMKNNGLMGVS
jgi:imidazolonepropionase-like amidohydrolase